jgi:hypothetical protein
MCPQLLGTGNWRSDDEDQNVKRTLPATARGVVSTKVCFWKQVSLSPLHYFSSESELAFKAFDFPKAVK